MCLVKNGGNNVAVFYLKFGFSGGKSINITMKYAEVGIACNLDQDCLDLYGCPNNIAPNFCIKRYDTQPSFKISVEDCGGVIDFTDEDLVLEANMWAKAKLKINISESDDYLSFADNIGFFQVMQNDIIVIDKTRTIEHMLVIGFDESNNKIEVQRGYNGTVAQSWKKGSSVRILRLMDSPAQIESVYEDVLQPSDGTVLQNQLSQTLFVYNWQENSTNLPGCYWFEFKLIKMSNSSVEWTRRFPSSDEGFLIRIIDSPTKEL